MSELYTSTYGNLKLIAERYVNSLENGIIARLWNVYGFEREKEKYHVIMDFIDQYYRNGYIRTISRWCIIVIWKI
jgi:nucleoside-diphosphate-sugar epimerase